MMDLAAASRKVYEYVNRSTQTGSVENHVQDAVRLAYRMTVLEFHGKFDAEEAKTARCLAATATGMRIMEQDITDAVRHDQGVY